MNKTMLGAVAAVALAAAGAGIYFLTFRGPDIEKFYASAERLNTCEGWKQFLNDFAGSDSPWVKLARMQKKKACYVPPWERVFGGGELESAYAVAALPDGGVVVAGYTSSKDAGMWVLRLDGRGNVIWEKTFGGRKKDEAKAVAVLPGGDVVVAGYTGSKGAGKWDMWVLRLDGRGNVIWEKTFGGRDWDKAEAVAALPDGDVVVAGFTKSKGAGKWDMWVLRLDARGNVIWEKTFGGREGDGAEAIAALPDGGVVVAGWTISKGAGKEDMWVLRLDERGNVIWEKTFGGRDWDRAEAVAALPDGDVVVAGMTYSKGAGKGDMWVLRLDARGSVVWERTFGGSGWEGAEAVTALPDGDVVVAGSTESKGAGDWDMWVLRLDARGSVVWEKTFGGRRWDMAHAIAALPDGGVVAAGYTNSKGAGDWDMWILRLDGHGRAPQSAHMAPTRTVSSLPPRPSSIHRVGDKVCISGGIFFGLFPVTVTAYVEDIAAGGRVKLRIADTKGQDVRYKGVQLYQGTVLWDQDTNWRKC